IVRLFLGGVLVAVLDAAIPICIGRVTGLLSTHEPARLLQEEWPQFLVMAAIVFLARPAAVLLQNLTVNQAIAPGMSNLIRWQSHWHVVRQSWAYFQNDFAGRIAARVMQTGVAIREAIVMGADAAWYILAYGATAGTVLFNIDRALALPILGWFAGYLVLLRVFVPRMRDSSRAVSEMRSTLTGRIVDSYTNILTVKLFSRAKDEDDFVRHSMDEHTTLYRAQTRTITTWVASLYLLNACLLFSMTALAIHLWTRGDIPLAAVATALPMAWQLTNMAGWVARSIIAIFDNLGLGGLRQRIAIARVVLKDAPILVLDEATSALDSEIEAAIQEQLEGLMQGRTVIAIAHRLSTIAKLDRLVMLEAGRIIEQGTHAELLARGGAYARAWSRQSGGFTDL
ncbi:MAG: ABC transporter ATP-binding protein, partial [Acetobacteraceae bacterium]